VWLYQKNIILGSLYLTTGDTAYIDSTIIDGSGDDCNVAIVGDIDSTTRITGFTIKNGVGCVYCQGGGIYVESSSPRLDHLIIEDNLGNGGGGICLNGTSNATINEVLIQNNLSELGGGIFSYNSNPVITNCTLRNNQAIYGGGVYLTNSSPNMEHVSITDNITDEFGGGVFCRAYSSPSFDHLTISNNTANDGGGIYSIGGSIPSFTNSIFWDNIPVSIVSHEDSLFAIYSNIEGGWVGESNIHLDPLFCSIDSGNYSLAENSPCLGSGEGGTNMGSMNIGCNSIILLPSNFSLLVPENNYQLVIDEFNQHQSLLLSWEESFDINSDSLTYFVSIHSENLYSDTIETSYTSWEISYENFINLFSDSLISSSFFYWDVSVSDFDTSIISSNGPLMFTVEVSELLLNNNLVIPSEFKLHQNYPNPFNPLTKIQYDIPNINNVSIIIYDLIGKNIKSLVNSEKPAGFYSVAWDGTNNFGKTVSAGIYVYMIQTGEFRSTKKMVLLK
jgi:hypothetical protein